MEDELLTFTEAAQIAGVDTSTLRRAAINKDLKAAKKGNLWLVKRSDLEKWMEEGRRPMGPPRKHQVT